MPARTAVKDVRVVVSKYLKQDTAAICVNFMKNRRSFKPGITFGDNHFCFIFSSWFFSLQFVIKVTCSRFQAF